MDAFARVFVSHIGSLRTPSLSIERASRYSGASVLRLLCAAAALLLPTALPAQTAQLDPTVGRVIQSISTKRIAGSLAKLESFETRHTFSPTAHPTRGIGATRRWIHEELSSYSDRLQVRFDSYHVKKKGRLHRNVEIVNVVALLPGTLYPNTYVVVSAHYDSLNLLKEDAESDMPFGNDRERDPEKIAAAYAPGVVDDGSGTAAVLELARVMSQHEFEKSVLFVAFAAEEQGLVGSKLFAARAREDDWNIEAVFNNDIIGSDTAGNGAKAGQRVRVFSDGPQDSPSRQLARYIRRHGERYVPGFSADLIFRRDRFGRGGDHTSFHQEGYAAVRFTTPTEHYSNQHTPTDRLAGASADYTAQVARLNAAGIASLALAPATPINTGSSRAPLISRGASRYDAVLAWECLFAEPDLAGFTIVMRKTTAPFWGKEIRVGIEGEHRLPNVSIDEWVFGVKAIDHSGNESLVAPYVNPPRRPTSYELY